MTEKKRPTPPIDPAIEAEAEKLLKAPLPRGVIEPEDDELLVNRAEVAKIGPRSSRAAVAMRIAGAPYDEIARVAGYKSAADARTAVETQLAASYDESSDIAGLRGLANARLESLMRGLAPKAMNPNLVNPDGTPKVDDKGRRVENPEHLAYSRQYLATVDRWIKLHGLDAPQVHRFETPEVAEFNSVIANLLEATGRVVVEADIFDAEIVEDEDESDDTPAA